MSYFNVVSSINCIDTLSVKDHRICLHDSCSHRNFYKTKIKNVA